MTEVPTEFEPDRFLTLKQTAAVLGVSVWTVNYHRNCGRLRVTRLGRNRVGIRKAELRRFIAAQDADLTAWISARAERKHEKAERYDRWLKQQGLMRIPQCADV